MSRLRQESGQTLILTVFAMVVLVAITAFAIDVSMILLARHQAQVAADAGALSAAQELTGGGSDSDTTQDVNAANQGTTVATYNDPNSSVQVTAPYGGVDATSAQAVVSKSVSLPLASVLGLSETVRATAVAQNNLVQNGSFDATTVPNGTYIEYCAADAVVPLSTDPSTCKTANPTVNNWTVYSGGVDLQDSSYIPDPPGDPTAQTLDLVGSCNGTQSTGTCSGSGCPPDSKNGGSLNVSNVPESQDTCQTNGEIYEKLNTITNDTYTVSFDLSANPHGTNAPPNKLLSIWVSKYNPAQYGLGDGVSTDAGYASVISGSQPVKGIASSWTPESYTFSAPGSSTYLWFVSNEGCDDKGTTLTGFEPDYVALAPYCDFGAAITDISVTGPGALNLTQ